MDPTRPCRFVRPVVSFAPSDGVLRAVAVVEQGAARDADVLAFAEDLDASSAVDRFRIAADGASTGALLVDGGRGGEALRVVRLDDGVAPDDDAPAGVVRGRGRRRGRLAPRGRSAAPALRAGHEARRRVAARGIASVPRARGLPLRRRRGADFGVCSDDDPLSRCLAGAPAEARDSICTNLDGTSIEITLRRTQRYTAQRRRRRFPKSSHCSTAPSMLSDIRYHLSVAPLRILSKQRIFWCSVSSFFLLRFGSAFAGFAFGASARTRRRLSGTLCCRN